MAGNQQVVKELLGSQAEQQVKITRGVCTYFKEAQQSNGSSVESNPVQTPVAFSFLVDFFFLNLLSILEVE